MRRGSRPDLGEPLVPPDSSGRGHVRRDRRLHGRPPESGSRSDDHGHLSLDQGRRGRRPEDHLPAALPRRLRLVREVLRTAHPPPRSGVRGAESRSGRAPRRHPASLLSANRRPDRLRRRVHPAFDPALPRRARRRRGWPRACTESLHGLGGRPPSRCAYEDPGALAHRTGHRHLWTAGGSGGGPHHLAADPGPLGLARIPRQGGATRGAPRPARGTRQQLKNTHRWFSSRERTYRDGGNFARIALTTSSTSAARFVVSFTRFEAHPCQTARWFPPSKISMERVPSVYEVAETVLPYQPP